MPKKRTPSAGPSLWTKNFTILTLGSVVSMLGNTLSGFAMSLLVLDYTQSSFYYAIYVVAFTLPQIVMPIVSGAVLDRFSRKKTIYTLDFASAALYFLGAYILSTGYFDFGVLALYCFVLGTINSVYTVAYQSFYPLLITEGNYSKAYSISSVIETISAVMVPISAFVYNLIGMVPLLLFNATSFLIAAIMETRIDAAEDYISLRKADAQPGTASAKQLLSDIREGIRYLATEKGLLLIAVYFTFAALAGGASSVITLPYFTENFDNGEYIYMVVWGMAIIGRAIGGGILYRIKLPEKLKFALAMAAYLITSLLEAVYLYFGIPVMMAACFVNGLMGVTSYTIRTSTTQSYVPDEKKGRFNGAFNMLSTAGNLSGELLAGGLTLILAPRTVLMAFMLLNAAAAIVLIGGGKKHVKKVYEIKA